MPRCLTVIQIDWYQIIKDIHNLAVLLDNGAWYFSQIVPGKFTLALFVKYWVKNWYRYLQSLAKLPVSPNQKSFWTKESCPISSRLRARSTQNNLAQVFSSTCLWAVFITVRVTVWQLAKLLVSPNQKSFWKKYHAPSLAVWIQGQLRGIRQTHTESFSQNIVTTFGH